MTWWQAVWLGLVEGITEFLPVSSTGHLLVSQHLLGIADDDASRAYAICIQAGAIVAVVLVFRDRLVGMARGVVGGNPGGRRLLLQVLLAFLPAAVIGPVLDGPVEDVLFGMWPIVFAWTVGAVGIFAFDWWFDRKRGVPLEGLDWAGAAIIGVAQCLALWPGTSRSLVTMVAGVLIGLSLPAAVEFSFLLGLLTLTAATAFKAVKHTDEMIAAYGALPIALGFLVAAVSAFVAVKWMVAWLNERGLGIFGWWRLVAAAGVAVMLLMGWA